MSRITDPQLLVARTCTTRDEKAHTLENRPLADFRTFPAYVLLGDPGAGKTESFKEEAEAIGGYFVRARSFAALDPSAELVGKTLFIDGLDEMRAGGGDGRTPLDYVRRHLDRLGRPHFRLSCREADWYGDSDIAALLEVAPEGGFIVLHLDPLADNDIAFLLERKYGIADHVGFVQQAVRHGLADLLHNPQTLGLLVSAVGANAWPNSRRATYDLACQQLVREVNDEHRNAKRTNECTNAELFEAAQFLCAVHLLAGIAGFTLDDSAVDDQHIFWREIISLQKLPLQAALASGIFRRDERDQQRIPVHRNIAEFLGAQYLTSVIENQGLSLGRILALMSGEDGGIVPDLRGLAAWLAVHSRTARAELITRDPLGVVIYGDVRDFQPDDKRFVMAALKGEAERYANFRFEDWTAAPFGALATPDMVQVFIELLALPSRNESDIALLDCALDALQYGPPLAELATQDELLRLESLLDAVARDASYPSHIRQGALKILLHNLPRNAARLVTFARDIQTGKVGDEDDQLLGKLLTELFPNFISPSEVFDYLHQPRQQHFIGDYYSFWGIHLPDSAQVELIPEILDQLVQRSPSVKELLDGNHASRIIGRILARALETHGDVIDNERLYEWLGIGLDKYGHPQIDVEHQKRVAAWLSARPERYKAVLLTGVANCIGKKDIQRCLLGSSARLYYAEPPEDIIFWYLDQAATKGPIEFRRHFFEEAVIRLQRQGGQECLTLEAIELLEGWMATRPEFATYLEPFITCTIENWRKDEFARVREAKKKREQQFKGWRDHFREHLDAIRDGSAHPQILHQLAQVYLRQYIDIDGETSRERLADFLGDDEELIAAAYASFRRSLDRNDLPSVAEIVDLETKGRMHFIRQPCLAGMEELYASDHEAVLHLNEEVLRKLLVFRLTWYAEKDSEWFTGLVKARPDLTAEALIAYALPLLRKGQDHLNCIWQLAYDDDYAEVARAALPVLLKRFPLRAKKKQLTNVLDPLLKASLRYLDRPVLAAIISARLAQSSLSAAQRVYWLACGLMLLPNEYEVPLSQHVGASKVRCGYLGAFFHNFERHPGFITALPETSLALLIELLAPDNPPERPKGPHWVSPAMQTADVVGHFIDLLGANPSTAAQQQLERLLALHKLTPWHYRLRHALYTQRIARRKAEFRPSSVAEVCFTLANRKPANIADLAALAYDHLRDLARKIRDGSTNDYRQYWDYDENHKPVCPKLENDCRDILLSDLEERLGRVGVEAVKEGYYAEDKRADIRVSFGGAAGFNVPIEIKRDNHADLWRAIREQLIERYTRDPGADGFGIYLVFWFGGKNMPLPQEGKKPRNAAQLEERLRQTLSASESRHISICVIDCTLP